MDIEDAIVSLTGEYRADRMRKILTDFEASIRERVRGEGIEEWSLRMKPEEVEVLRLRAKVRVLDSRLKDAYGALDTAITRNAEAEARLIEETCGPSDEAAQDLINRANAGARLFFALFTPPAEKKIQIVESCSGTDVCDAYVAAQRVFMPNR